MRHMCRTEEPIEACCATTNMTVPSFPSTPGIARAMRSSLPMPSCTWSGLMRGLARPAARERPGL